MCKSGGIFSVFQTSKTTARTTNMHHPPRLHSIIHLHLVLTYLAVDVIATTSSNTTNLLKVDVSTQSADPSFIHQTASSGWECLCHNVAESYAMETECRCVGATSGGQHWVGPDLDPQVERLTIADAAALTVLPRDALQRYRGSLRDIILSNLPTLIQIESGTFRDISNLRTIYISHTPLMYLPGLLEGVTSTKFLSLRIIQTNLLELPDFNYLPKKNILHMIDLENNLIERIPANSMKVRAEQVTLNYNKIAQIEDYAFNGSEIARLNLRGNYNMRILGHQAFAGLKSLLQLDVSDTIIEHLPINGLENIEILKIENTPSMTVIPSIYDFVHLREAYLTHPFHCCAFKYPEQHNPVAFKQHAQRLRQNCAALSEILASANVPLHQQLPSHGVVNGLHSTEPPLYDTGQWGEAGGGEDEDLDGELEEDARKRRRKRRRRRRRRRSGVVSMDDTSAGWEGTMGWSGYSLGSAQWAPVAAQAPQPAHAAQTFPSNYSNHHQNPLRGSTIERAVGISPATGRDVHHAQVEGTFLDATTDLSQHGQIQALCGNLTIRISLTSCEPEPNALNPCEDIMGSAYLRISVWFVVVLAVVGNVAVMVVVLFSGGELTVPRFLMCNLACADLCMGLYLLLIASMDLHSVGTYFNFAFAWQYGAGCQLAGFLTVFASQLSIFTLTVLTVERWFAITYAIYLTKRIRISVAAKIMVAGYAYSVLMATLPLLGISNYSSTSICLPMEVNHLSDRAYLMTLILIDGLAFVLIVFCYAQIYLSLTYETRHASHKGEMTIAKKMALLVFTDFFCWAPIAFFSLTALAGYPLIGVTRSKILLVFFYPLNSCANPYLYAIMTAQYRKDFFILLAKCGLCTKKTKNCTMDTSLPTNSNPIPLLTRVNANGRKSSAVATNLEDAFV